MRPSPQTPDTASDRTVGRTADLVADSATNGGDSTEDPRIEALFGTVPMSRRRSRRIGAVLATVAVLAAGVGAVASLAGAAPTSEYRTAAAELRSVAATISSVATIESVDQAAVSFSADGTVASVDVAVGDEVTVGQQLAALNVVELERALNTRKAALAEAELALAKALAGESTSDTGAPDTGASVGGGAERSGSAGAGSTAASTATRSATTTTVTATTPDVPAGSDGAGVARSGALEALQTAVVDAQRAVDVALTESTAALDAAAIVCEDLGGSTGGTASTGDQADSVEPADDAVGATPTTGSTSVTACRTALDTVQGAQSATAAAQQRLAAASSELDAFRGSADSSPAAAEVTGATGSATAGGTTGTVAQAGVAASSGASTGGGIDDASSSPSAAQLVALQKSVSAAELQVLVAEQAVARAAIVAPIAGTVVAVGLDVGESVSAASATQLVLIQGDGGVEAVTTVALSRIADVAIGQPATVLPDGSGEPIEGTVVAIAATADSAGTGSSYRVTIGFADPDVAVGSGTTATASIVTSAVTDAVAVPSSALRWEDGNPTVSTVQDGVASAAVVGVGVVGGDWIEITDGIEAGEPVVLADLAEPLPSAATRATSSSTGSGPPGMGGGAPSGPPDGFGS